VAVAAKQLFFYAADWTFVLLAPAGSGYKPGRSENFIRPGEQLSLPLRHSRSLIHGRQRRAVSGFWWSGGR